MLLLLRDGSLEEEVGDGRNSRMMLLLRGAGSRRMGRRSPVAGAADRRGRSQRVAVAQSLGAQGGDAGRPDGTGSGEQREVVVAALDLDGRGGGQRCHISGS
jgi:hypothetical protein